MHQAAYNYIERQRPALSPLAGKRGVNIGAYNVNGSVAPLLSGGSVELIGVDIRPGPDVDLVVQPGQTLAQALAAAGIELDFHFVVSTETIEHAADPEQLLRDAWEVLRPGGVLLLTGAAPERTPHGCDGGSVVPEGESYQNIDPVQLREWLSAWVDVEIEHNPDLGDVYAKAVKSAQKARRGRAAQAAEEAP